MGWRRLTAAHAAGDDDLSGLDPWAARHLDRLADLEAGWPAATEGRTLLHADLRADNLLLTPTRVVAVDWPYACVGAAWVDLLLLLPSVTMQGGPDPEPTFAARGNTRTLRLRSTRDLNLAGALYGPSTPVRMESTGDLSVDSLMAVDWKTGALKWYFQHVHHDMWDMDAPGVSRIPACRDVCPRRDGH